ncbi:MAG: LacI family DNA-binding transcriptional regulator [Oscillospiraceae bacterium]
MHHKGNYATISDVAKLANTSTATVSYVLRNDPSRVISDELRKRVLAASEQLHYTKSSVASGLRGSSRGLVTVLIPQFSNIFFTRICERIERNIIPMICDTREEPEREKRIIENAINQRADGIIIGPTSEGWKNTEMIRHLDIPLVAIGRDIAPPSNSQIPQADKDQSVYFVADDGYQAGFLAGSTFASLGHKKIGMIDWNGSVSSSIDRRAGFFDALKCEHSLDAEVFVASSSILDSETGYRLTKELLSKSMPTAIFYGYHRLAQGGILYLREMGISIPNDISVMMIGTPAWAQLSTPQISTIRQRENDIGTTAGHILMALMAGNDDELLKTKNHIFPCEITNFASVKRMTK